ncbi:hypothetical protein SAMN04244553_2918 [Nocardia amikacinitolerans]|uniref:Uncharacterized protein n=1 Tax=Nocardia amikacinitolerans TaxID=756689 RepID=A0A285L8P8_9NOCA|nr:hypothetical protein [Nocardia amikacinitolerans]MCP2277550.1 hypothetical protein [Nocardia amikacinitolerans]MCP2298942.1 hypothetical protein [Nocardia amikacinitolerans]MCP2320830.1 hypothetical protein [Nocardia amikacinitolerans]SNY81328.1 hypothetical protein SAMN04244553_2918 [Nocardia amikacinitolerans]
MLDQLTIGGWVVVGEHCSVRRAALHCDDYLTYVFENGGTELDFAIAPAVLRRMVELSEARPPGDESSD